MDSKADQRLTGLKQWLDETLDAPEYEIQPASADASFRRYFRVTVPGTSYIIMDAPPDKEDTGPFIAVAEHFLAIGLNVPEILFRDTAQGYLILTDFGSQSYLDALNAHTVERLYGDALGALAVLQTGTYVDPHCLPPYDEALLQTETGLFRDWYLGTHLGISLSDDEQASLQAVFDVLSASALAQPQVWVHRDYHSRNLMVVPRHNPGVIDFQDAVLGPVTYDLVSLLRDCYIAWPRAQVEDWVRGYHRLARQCGIPVCDEVEEFQRWFDLMGVQRHLKATGIFARLNHRDGKPGYLGDIPRTLAYIAQVAPDYPELAFLDKLLKRLPAATSI